MIWQIIGAFLRPSFISLLYVGLALIAPLLPSITSRVPAATKTYLFVTFAVSLLASLLQLIYQVYAVTSHNFDKVDFCDRSDYRYWMNQLGLIRYFFVFTVWNGYLSEVTSALTLLDFFSGSERILVSVPHVLFFQKSFPFFFPCLPWSSALAWKNVELSSHLVPT